MHEYHSLIVAAVLVLVPLIPAIAMFKMFPTSQADGEGPFAGMKWKIQGAFGGYILVALLMWSVVHMMPKPAQVEIWTVRGKVIAEKQTLSSNVLKIGLQPQHELYVAPDGVFELKLVGTRQGEKLKFPRMIFAFAGGCFDPRTVSVDGSTDTFDNIAAGKPMEVHREQVLREIEIRTPIALKRNPAANCDQPPA